MKIADDTWTIVLAGNWNRYVLSPEWTARHVFDQPGLTVEFPLDLKLPFRYSSPDVRIVPSSNMVVFVALKHENSVLELMENMAIKLVDKLQYTPATAFGINFGFVEDIEKAGLSDLFKLSDIGRLSDYGCGITETSISRRLIVEDKVLNLSIKHNVDKVYFNFNFHYDVKDAPEIRSKIGGEVLKNKIVAESILKTVYKLEFDTVEV